MDRLPGPLVARLMTLIIGVSTDRSMRRATCCDSANRCTRRTHGCTNDRACRTHSGAGGTNGCTHRTRGNAKR
jgi:hypothetical protein